MNTKINMWEINMYSFERSFIIIVEGKAYRLTPNPEYLQAKKMSVTHLEESLHLVVPEIVPDMEDDGPMGIANSISILTRQSLLGLCFNIKFCPWGCQDRENKDCELCHGVGLIGDPCGCGGDYDCVDCIGTDLYGDHNDGPDLVIVTPFD